MVSARPDRFQIPEAQHQFGGFPIGGFGGFAPGSGGFGFGGLRGGFIGGGGGGAPAGSIGPLLTLEAVFGTGFTAQSIADAILVQEQGESSSTFRGGVVIVTEGIPDATGAAGTLIFNTISGLFQILGANGGVRGSGRTPDEAAANLPPGTDLNTFGLDPVLSQPPTFAERLPPVGGPTGGGDFNELLRTILGALGQLQGGRRTPQGLEPVAIGGSVNVPVVPGSTADPTGTLRPVQRLPGRPAPTFEERLAAFPRAPATQPARPALPSAREVLPSVALEILQLILRERAEKQLRDAQRRAQEIQAQRLASFRELIRRFQMPFHQQAFGLGLKASDPRGPLETAGVGGGFLTTITDILIGLGTNISADLLTRLNVTRDPERREITVPNGESEIEAALRALQQGGGAATQCGLFRGGGGTRVSSRPASVVCLPDPITGEARFFGHLGRPLVFQRDVTMAKNIPKLIRKLGGSSHRSKR